MLIKIIYLVLASLMFYFVEGAISAGGFGFMYRYLFGMAIIGLAMASFIVKPNMDRAKRLTKGVLIMSTPYAVTVSVHRSTGRSSDPVSVRQKWHLV